MREDNKVFLIFIIAIMVVIVGSYGIMSVFGNYQQTTNYTPGETVRINIPGALSKDYRGVYTLFLPGGEHTYQVKIATLERGGQVNVYSAYEFTEQQSDKFGTWNVTMENGFGPYSGSNFLGQTNDQTNVNDTINIPAKATRTKIYLVNDHTRESKVEILITEV